MRADGGKQVLATKTSRGNRQEYGMKESSLLS